MQIYETVSKLFSKNATEEWLSCLQDMLEKQEKKRKSTFKNRSMTDAADCEPHAGELVF